MSKRYVSWEEYENLLKLLASRVSSSISYIYGVPRGGLIPAVMLSHILDIPMVLDMEHAKNSRLLVVDDIADSGKTLEKYGHHECATIFVNSKHCVLYPDYYSEKTEDWIVFPYEKENVEDTVSSVLCL